LPLFGGAAFFASLSRCLSFLSVLFRFHCSTDIGKHEHVAEIPHVIVLVSGEHHIFNMVLHAVYIEAQ
jgi:hypothetical protein